MAKTPKRVKPAAKPTQAEGRMGDGSDLHFIGEEAVYSDTQGPKTFNIGDPRQVAARLRQRRGEQ